MNSQNAPAAAQLILASTETTEDDQAQARADTSTTSFSSIYTIEESSFVRTTFTKLYCTSPSMCSNRRCASPVDGVDVLFGDVLFCARGARGRRGCRLG